MVVGAFKFLEPQHSGDWGKRTTPSLRPAWAPQQILDQLGTHLSQRFMPPPKEKDIFFLFLSSLKNLRVIMLLKITSKRRKHKPNQRALECWQDILNITAVIWGSCIIWFGRTSWLEAQCWSWNSPTFSELTVATIRTLVCRVQLGGLTTKGQLQGDCPALCQKNQASWVKGHRKGVVFILGITEIFVQSDKIKHETESEENSA